MKMTLPKVSLQNPMVRTAVRCLIGCIATGVLGDLAPPTSPATDCVPDRR